MQATKAQHTLLTSAMHKNAVSLSGEAPTVAWKQMHVYWLDIEIEWGQCSQETRPEAAHA